MSLIFLMVMGCKIIISTPLPTEIAAVSIATPVATAQSVQVASVAETVSTPDPAAAAAPEVTPVPTPTTYFLQGLSTNVQTDDPDRQERALPRHGLGWAFLLPLIVFGIPWLIFEIFTVRYVQPRGIDLSTVRIKAQDGLFIQATASMTVRRNLSLASTRMTWSGVRSVMEKAVEQELIHEALSFETLEELERNLKAITERFLELPVIRELYRDFGVEVLRFNIESFYPQETMDALNRKAEASAGGAAYLAYASAAHLDPETNESRELYRIYQQTTSRVDAARNLGGGIAAVANVLRRDEKKDNEEENR